MSTCSDCVYRLIRLARAAGLTVDELAYDRLPEDVAGRYDHEDRSILVNAATAKGALVAMAHELGHWAGYAFQRREHSYQRERQAFVHGWRFVLLVGGDRFVSREDWISHHRADAKPTAART